MARSLSVVVTTMLVLGAILDGTSVAAPRHLSLVVSPSTAHVGASATVSGRLAPAANGVSVVVQRAVGRDWVAVGRTKTTSGGRYALTVRVPGKATLWRLRVTSAAATSAAVLLRVVKPIFVVRATATASVVVGQPVVVTGRVLPKARGPVSLQVLRKAGWVTVAKAALSATSAFSVRAVLPVGSYRLRVVKAFTATTAAGTSKAVGVQVTAVPLPAPVVATTSLPAATVGLPYSTALTASGGLAPLTWSLPGGGLPSGLTLAPSGLITGTPLAALSATLVVRVTDAQGLTGDLPLVLSVAVSRRAGNVAYGWGSNFHAQLGDGTIVDRSSPVQVSGLTGLVAIGSGGQTGYGVRFDGTVWAWGDNGMGQYGNGSTVSSAVPVRVSALDGVTAIAGGPYTGYALRADGTVWSFGDDTYGELGDGGGRVNSLVPVRVAGLTGVTAIAAGEVSAYALRSDGTVWAWGTNDTGELGNFSITDSEVPVQVVGLTGVTAIATAGETGYAVTGGAVWAWGAGGQGQLGNGATNSSTSPVQVTGLTGVTAVGATLSSGYALRGNGTVAAWGRNHDGDLGDGTTTDRSLPVDVGGLTGVTALAGGFTPYALRANGTVWAWGDGIAGALGNGGTADSSVPVQVSGLSRVVAIGSGSDAEGGLAISGRLGADQ